jgi:hypothetical protein
MVSLVSSQERERGKKKKESPQDKRRPPSMEIQQIIAPRLQND